MSRKKLGFVLLAVLVVSATAATAAHADDLTSEQFPVTLTGKNTSENDKLVTTTGTVNCKTATYTGTASGATTSIAVTPSFEACTAFGFPATVDVNGCKFIFNIGLTRFGDLDISCIGGLSITVTAISAGTPKCTVHIASQNDILGEVSYSNSGSGTTREIGVLVKVFGIDYSHTKGTGLGACTAGSSFSGTLEAAGTITGEKDTIAVPEHIGLFLT